MTKAPEIRIALSLDGKVRDVHVVVDTAKDRDAALARLRIFLPAIELLETLAVGPAKGTSDGK